MIIAYARVSTEQQSLDRQTDMLTQYGYDEIFTEKYTGTKASRPEFDKVNLMLRKGDVLIEKRSGIVQISILKTSFS